ncbi:MAG: hypothetical protein FWF70_06095 [Bacteroidetes bacterium]|nr:hypothetical protein [Bacteroidota bacterium]MCL1968621.1 hypothetical protein [Bacteroidota bacterium]
MAGLVYPVTHSSANGIPLSAELNHKHQGIIALDTGIMQQSLKLDISRLFLGKTLQQINKRGYAKFTSVYHRKNGKKRHQSFFRKFWKK